MMESADEEHLENTEFHEYEIDDTVIDEELFDEDEDENDLTEEETQNQAGPAFADLGLPDELLSAITRMGYVTPTPIQAEAIPALMRMRDVVGIAQTGTGKTAAFGLPLLSVVDADEKAVQALVLAPTRELAMQSAQAIESFASMTRGLDIVPVYGGSAYGPQIGALKRGAQVVVGTPGRVIDLIEKGALDLSFVRMLVLDEADEMLRMGFAEDVETIAESVPDERLTALFSATMPAAIERVAQTHLNNPLRIAVSEESSTVDTIEQTYAVVPYKHKIGALARVLATRTQNLAHEDADAAIVFVRTRMDVEEISLELSGRGFRAAGISGDVAQTERERMVERLKNGSLDVLVATDVAARGLDVERIGLVVNFDVPREPEAYVHRIGRTGRAGREGRSLTFFTPREHGRLRRIERLTGTPMQEVQIPSPVAVSEFRARRILDTVNTRIERGRLDLYYSLLDEIHDATELDVSDIAAVLLAQAVGDEGPEPRVRKDRRGDGRIRREEEVDEAGEFVGAVFEVGRDKDRPLKGGKDGARRRGGARALSGTGRRYRVEVGKKDRVKPGAIVGAITGEGGLAGSDIGNIEIYPTFSLVEIAGDVSSSALGRIAKARVSGRALRIREDEGPQSARHFDTERHSSRGERGRRGESREYSERGRHDRSERGYRGEKGSNFDRRDGRYDRSERRDRLAGEKYSSRGDRRFGSSRGRSR
ncbi:DEAD/DEAH box helicase [Schaalia sp. lx-100]|uniref:DEAD/DEAH box helicase n=1 Tax=Schaalia sp. lx-100 TaxID=2899081 RepID=UPI001E52366E|nr:DEAD/DEAH box helicase [Schaalia sp. lx-100]MCD4557393.1 DEAD/DEAH box helicase [Schaalia sp. lx-100]